MKVKTKSKAKKSKPAKAKSKKPVRKVASKRAKKPTKAKVGKKRAAAKPKMNVIPPANGVLVGRVEDYFAQIGVIAFTVLKPFRVGDHLQVLGHTTHLEQTVDSMQIDHQAVTQARPRDAVGIKVASRARRGDYIFIIQA